MTTSSAPVGAFVWVWLPGATEPVVAGRVEQTAETLSFFYGQSYLSRQDRISLFAPELPLREGRIEALPGLNAPGCIRDSAPDAWGQRVILARRLGKLDSASDTGQLSLLTYLLESGSNRVGGLDFQADSKTYVARGGDLPTLADMQEAADRLNAGEVLPHELAQALLHGTSIGGARPKVTIDTPSGPAIAKLSVQSDVQPVVRMEAVAMDLAACVGVDVAVTELTAANGRDVLLVHRFDRTAIPGERKLMVSALTILGLDEFLGVRDGSYIALADQIRASFTNPRQTLEELFRRVVFNVCVSNNDDHPRNHAAFWDGEMLNLTPAYDICPGMRSGDTSFQAMAVTRSGDRRSLLALLRSSAADFLLASDRAADIVSDVVDGIETHWADASERCRLTAADKALMWRRLILNPAIHHEA